MKQITGSLALLPTWTPFFTERKILFGTELTDPFFNVTEGTPGGPAGLHVLLDREDGVQTRASLNERGGGLRQGEPPTSSGGRKGEPGSREAWKKANPNSKPAATLLLGSWLNPSLPPLAPFKKETPRSNPRRCPTAYASVWSSRVEPPADRGSLSLNPDRTWERLCLQWWRTNHT